PSQPDAPPDRSTHRAIGTQQPFPRRGHPTDRDRYRAPRPPRPPCGGRGVYRGSVPGRAGVSGTVAQPRSPGRCPVTLLQSVAPAAPDEVVAQGEALTPAEVDALVERAQRAQAGWARLDAPARAAALTALAQAIEDRADQLGRLIAWEVGKPIGE